MWTLIIYIYAGVLARGDSVALDHVDGFANEQMCIAAAEKTKTFVSGSAKEHRFVCVQKSK